MRPARARYPVPYYQDLRMVASKVEYGAEKKPVKNPPIPISLREIDNLSPEQLRKSRMPLEKIHMFHTLVTNEGVMQDHLSDLLIKRQNKAQTEEEFERIGEKIEKSEARKLQMFTLKKELERMMNRLAP